MDSINYISYEVIDPVSNKRFITESRDEAASFFEEEWIVIEHHQAKYKPSAHTQMVVDVRMSWNNNPEFEGV